MQTQPGKWLQLCQGVITLNKRATTQIRPALTALLLAITALLSIVLINTPLHTLHAQEAAKENTKVEDTLLVIDGSGSMWGKIEDGHKIMIVREVLADTLRPLENQLSLGLMAYGHRRRGACTDIETLRPPSPLNTNQFIRLVNRIKPLGKTPITNALTQASKVLGKKGGNIILLTDGPENCRQNPCQLITPEFSKSNKLRVHVVAFSMTAKDAASLKCLADNSGGLFLTADNKEQLATSLKTAFNGLKGLKAPIAATKEPVKTLTRPELTLSAHLGPDTKPLTDKISWKLEKLTKEQQPDAELPPWKSTKPEPKFDLEAGSYRIAATYKNYEIKQIMTLENGQAYREKLIFNLAEVELPAGWDQANARSGFGRLLMQPEKTETKSEDKEGKEEKNTPASEILQLTAKPQIMLVRAGAYRLTGLNNGKLESWIIEADPGKITKLPIWQNTGRLQLTMKDNTTGKPLTTPLVRVLHYDPVKKTAGKELARSTAHNPQFDLNQGDYLIELTEGFIKKAVITRITRGYTTHQNMALERAALTLNINNPQQGESWTATLYRQEGKKLIYVGTATNLNEPLILPPATYRIALHNGGTTNTLKQAYKLKAGKSQTLKFKSRSAPVQLKISNRNDPLSRHQIFWQVYSNAGNLIWQSTKAEPRLNLAEGQYIVKAEIGNDYYQEKIRIRGIKENIFDLSNSRQ